MRSICEAILMDAMYEAPTLGKSVYTVTLDYAKERVDKFAGKLQAL